MSPEIPSRYAPTDVEGKWYAAWEAAGCFRPECCPADGEPYVVVIPPPNVTGVLHMGHALNQTIQDVLVRFRRMQGRRTLWVPGTDHAGIATQNVVEKSLAAEGRSREDLGRKEFVERCWEWVREYGDGINVQLRRMGFSCDWTRHRFTFDEGLSKAVATAFVDLFRKDLIYRGERLINWCPRCQTALSDEEAETSDEAGHLWHLRYPLEGEPGRHLVVATTRPETMLGDTAVAVHPDDARYSDLVGRNVVLPLMDRPIPVVADAHADPGKGSGAVKITPAHDFNDFQVGERHGLARINIMEPDGTLNARAGSYAGMDRFEARKRVLEDLEAAGLLAGSEDRDVPLPRCYRCRTVVEPYLSNQWFVRMRPLLEPAAAAVREGAVRILPERYARTYLDWVEQYRDWCISRQIWWGHRIPVWYDEDEVPFASVEPLEIGAAHPGTGKPLVRRDEDVLDTWFSSQLWPFSVLGWPDETPDLAAFYPTNDLVTARDIIYFWVARMVMSGLAFRGEVPFRNVIINGTVLDSVGRRMSKSLGNGIDPLEMGDRYGMDALRWSVLLLSPEGQDLKLTESRFEGGRNFVNKLWNASRFVLMNLDQGMLAEAADPTTPEDRWIMSRLHATIRDVTVALEEFRLYDAGHLLHAFTWNVFCDWYLELCKSRLTDDTAEGAASRATAGRVLVLVLDPLLRMLHPFIPFVTEEIRSLLRPHLPGGGEFLMTDRWPASDPACLDPEAEREVDTIVALVRAARMIRERMGLSPRQPVALAVRPAEARGAAIVERVRDRTLALGGLSGLEVGVGLPKPPRSAAVVAEGLEIFVPLEGLIDLDRERERLGRELAEARKHLANARAKLANEKFTARAPAEVVALERARAETLEAKQARLAEHLADLD